jgi:hypothetical protein
MRGCSWHPSRTQVQTAFALGAVNGQYILLYDSIYSEYFRHNAPRDIEEGFEQANAHQSAQLMAYLSNNPVLQFKVDRIGETGHYEIEGPYLRQQHNHTPCLCKYDFTIV